MSDSALRDELMTLLVAGQETSAILLGWASALLAHHPEVQVGRTGISSSWLVADGGRFW
jgi:cytochrome P450